MSAQEEIAKLKERIAYLEGQLSMAKPPYYPYPSPPQYWLDMAHYQTKVE